jgi:hypothetical protein
LDTEAVSFSRHIVAEAAVQLGSKRIMIHTMSKPFVGNWISMIQANYPNDTIVHVDKIQTNTYGDPETDNRVWFIVQTDTVRNAGFIQQNKPDHLIVDRDKRYASYDVADIWKGIASELPRATFIYSVEDFWTNPDTPNNEIMFDSALNIVGDILGGSTYIGAIPVGLEANDYETYFRMRGVKFSKNAFLEAIGACFDIVESETSANFDIEYSNEMLVSSLGDRSRRRTELITRYNAMETSLLLAHGTTQAEVVDQALLGDQPAINLLEQLKSQEWAKLKAHMFHNKIRNQNRLHSKTIIIARNEHIRRFMAMTLQTVDIDHNESLEDLNKKLSNFVYPHPTARQFPYLPNTFVNKMSNTLMAKDFLNIDPRVLAVTERVIFTEYEYNRDVIADYIELARVLQFKLMFGTMRGTFEESLAEQLLSPYY